MSGPYGPNDPNQQGSQQPEGQQGWGAPPNPQQGQQPYGQPPQGQQWGAPQQPQYEQQPPYGQQPPQWGAPQGQQPGQLGQPSAPNWSGQQGPQQWGPQGQQWGPGPESNAGGSKTGLVIGLVVGCLVLVAAILAGVLYATGGFGAKTLDASAAADGVKSILIDSYGIYDVSAVTCPADQETKSGNSFQCDATVDGESRKVTVTFTDDNGTYEVSRPS